jgi:hypothetical protein
LKTIQDLRYTSPSTVWFGDGDYGQGWIAEGEGWIAEGEETVRESAAVGDWEEMAVGDRRLGGDGGQRSESGRRCQGHRDGGEQRSRRRQNINWFCFSDLFFPFFIILLFFFFNKPHHFLILIFFIGQVRSGTRVYTQKGVHQSFSYFFRCCVCLIYLYLIYVLTSSYVSLFV